MNKTLTTAFAAAGIGIGALAVGSAAMAQDYGSSDDSTVEAPAEPTTDDGVADEPVNEEQNNDGLEPIAGEGAGGRDRTGDGERRRPAGLVDGEGRGGHCGGGSLSTAAEIIGIEAEELEAAVESGQSIADIATSNGVDPQAVVDAMVDHYSERLAEKVAAGELTEDEAAERLAEKVDETGTRVNGEETSGDDDN